VPSRNGAVTEAPGGRHIIHAGAGLDAALDAAVCGDAPTRFAEVALRGPAAEVVKFVAFCVAVVVAVCAAAGPASMKRNSAMRNRTANGRLHGKGGLIDMCRTAPPA
jgi:hypothetical protein